MARTGGHHQGGSKFDESRGAERSYGGEWKGCTDAGNCCTPIGRVVIYLCGITIVLHVESMRKVLGKGAVSAVRMACVSSDVLYPAPYA